MAAFGAPSPGGLPDVLLDGLSGCLSDGVVIRRSPS
jgi:hypothetical protein